jgi:hypothetical protein
MSGNHIDVWRVVVNFAPPDDYHAVEVTARNEEEALDFALAAIARFRRMKKGDVAEGMLWNDIEKIGEQGMLF